MVSEIFRTYVAALLSPTAWLALLLVTATVLFWLNKIKIARLILTASTILFFLFTTGFFKTGLYSLLELSPQTVASDYKYVVVLGGRIFPNEEHPLSSQITSSLLGRLTHGIKYFKENPDSILVLTGNGAGEIPEAVRMKEFALEMGVPNEKIIVEQESMNTKDHPVYLKPILKNDKFIIVTSAYHMKRALKNFKAHGLEGIPAPTDYMNKDQDGISMGSIIPRGENLSALDRWMTEMYSTIWTHIRMTFN